MTVYDVFKVAYSLRNCLELPKPYPYFHDGASLTPLKTQSFRKTQTMASVFPTVRVYQNSTDEETTLIIVLFLKNFLNWLTPKAWLLTPPIPIASFQWCYPFRSKIRWAGNWRGISWRNKKRGMLKLLVSAPQAVVMIEQGQLSALLEREGLQMEEKKG